MSKAKLIRSGLWLLPWFPLFIAGIAVYTFFSPRRYVVHTIMDLNAPDHLVPPAPQLPLEFHPTLLAFVGLAAVLAFVAGLVLLVVGSLRRGAVLLSPPAA